MEYFELNLDYEPKVTGFRNGVGIVGFTDEFWKKNPFVKDFLRGENVSQFMKGEIPQQDLSLKGLFMEKVAKHTDFLHLRMLRGFIISDKVRTILESSHLPTHKFYEVEFYQPDKKTKEINLVKGYWWFFYNMETGEGNVDFQESEFDKSWHETRHPHQDLTVNTYQEYIRIVEQTGTAMRAKKLVFHKFDKQLDIWGTRFLSNINGYISERLVGKFNKQQVTGFYIRKPLCKMIFK